MVKVFIRPVTWQMEKLSGALRDDCLPYISHCGKGSDAVSIY